MSGIKGVAEGLFAGFYPSPGERAGRSLWFGFRLLCAVGLWWFVLAGGAWAVVEDPKNLLPAGQAQALDERLRTLGADEVVVVVVADCNEGVSLAAQSLFDARGLDGRGVLLLVSVPERQLGVALGESFTASGLTPAMVEALVIRTFTNRAQQDDYASALGDLVRQLKFSRATGRDERALGPFLTVPLGVLLVLAGLGVAAFAWFRRLRDAYDAVQDRLSVLKIAYSRLLPRLGEAEALGCDLTGVLREFHQALNRCTQELQDRQFQKAHQRLSELEPQFFWVETGLAVLQSWQANGVSSDEAQLRDERWQIFQKLALQWQSLAVTVGFMVETPGQRGVMLNVLKARLMEARLLLLKDPFAVAEAEVLIKAIAGQVATLAQERRITVKRTPTVDATPGYWDFTLPRFTITEAIAAGPFWES